MDITISSKSYHLGTSGIDTQLKNRKSTTVTFVVWVDQGASQDGEASVAIGYQPGKNGQRDCS